MRSPAEVAFRIRQEVANARMLLVPPRLPEDAPADAPAGLPDPGPVVDRLRGSAFERDVLALADSVLEHRFPLLGMSVHTGPEIDWRRDYVHGIASAPGWFRRVPYLDFARVGDHKIVWELNRHQHLVLLAQAWRFSGQDAYLGEIFAQWESWMAANPFLRGINWTSALEVAFRALSWMWVWRLAGHAMGNGLRRPFLDGLYRHGRFLEHNLSVYFSPNTHLLGEAVTLHALAVVFPQFPQRWRCTGADLVRRAMQEQVRADGGYFEQSTYYHVYALDLFLFHASLAPTPAEYREGLARMADYLGALFGPLRTMPFLGDDDGGRLFHPYGPRDGFGRATLATAAVLLGRDDWPREPDALGEQAAWWVGAGALDRSGPATAAPRSRLFPDTGTAVLTAEGVHIVVKAGPFGPGSGGHTHADTLSFTASRGDTEVLIDPGTYTYVSDPEWRDRFRGTAAHNTVRIDGLDQATPAGPFRWADRPAVEIRRWESTDERDYLEAECRYRGFVHRRRFVFMKSRLLFVLDEVDGPAGSHTVEQFWHPASEDAARRLGTSGAAERVEGWRSRALGHKEPAPALRLTVSGALPGRLAAVVDFAPQPGANTVTLSTSPGEVAVVAGGGARYSFRT